MSSQQDLVVIREEGVGKTCAKMVPAMSSTLRLAAVQRFGLRRGDDDPLVFVCPRTVIGGRVVGEVDVGADSRVVGPQPWTRPVAPRRMGLPALGQRRAALGCGMGLPALGRSQRR